MKNIITTIALFVMTMFASQAQVVVKFKSHYRYCHDTSLETVDALNRNLDSNLGSFKAFSIVTFDTVNMTFKMSSFSGKDTVRMSGYIYQVEKIKNEFGGTDYGFLVQYPDSKNPTTTYVFQNTTTQKLYMERTLSTYYLGKYEGIQAVMVDQF